MNIIFRTDASLDIGTGHVMRCLTLAQVLRDQGINCRFICREHAGNLLDLIRERGFEAQALPMQVVLQEKLGQQDAMGENTLAHAAWLGVDWQTDAEQTKNAIGELSADWLIVDHYALDVRWELALRPHYRMLMVIDDLADRKHVCDVLLDQNLVEGMGARYQDKVPSHCICLIGPQYALLRAEFVNLRPNSLARRKLPELHRLIVFMGGSDASNETGKVIAGIKLSQKTWQHIDVVVGKSYTALSSLQQSLTTLPATLHIQTPDMAKLMALADLAITAGGSVTWEKCVLALPSLVVVLGQNQQPIANMMHEQGALQSMGKGEELTPKNYAHYLDEIQKGDLAVMTERASVVCDGSGINKVIKVI